MPNPAAAKAPSRIAPDPAALEKAAERILAAEWPVLMPEFVGRAPNGFADMIALAETLGAPVADVGTRLNFPTEHPLDLRITPEVYKRADVMVGLDLQELGAADALQRPHQPDEEVLLSGKLRVGRHRLRRHRDQQVGDGLPEIPGLLAPRACRYGARDPAAHRPLPRPYRGRRRAAPTRRRAARHRRKDARRSARRVARASERELGRSPISLARLASEVWDQIRDEDWVLTGNAFEQWALKLWDFDRPYRHAGKALGVGTQIGIALGVALAHKDKGRLVVDCQTDGDLMFDVGALWFATKHEIPMLLVMHNNRAYYNDWEHQITVARQRNTPVERAYIGMDISGPEPDFAGIARSFGWYAEGPIEQPGDIAGALKRAIEQVKRGKPALVDTITQFKG